MAASTAAQVRVHPLRIQKLWVWLAWLCIIITVLNVLLMLAIDNLTGNHYSHEGTVIYPLLLHYYSAEFPWLELYVALLAVVGLVACVYRLSHPSDRFWAKISLLAFTIPAFLCVWDTIIATSRAPYIPLKHLSSLQFEGNQYHLTAAP